MIEKIQSNFGSGDHEWIAGILIGVLTLSVIAIVANGHLIFFHMYI
jgi:hypothetical protein